ncbi:hypothetical protein K435DRAFT_859729 [Dendrothele bispora CBS 962.96]|uniref:Uncharacterized protein n=1 Tax=Dendrothele bispora (strain CBS 962.96) TaxID=1314807 RepID=A0A4S8M073_DENBC|nr:hypothetical protein K435DRAFT_859729 [Dendrothele bispora CBS 962.96]
MDSPGHCGHGSALTSAAPHGFFGNKARRLMELKWMRGEHGAEVPQRQQHLRKKESSPKR